MTTICIITGLVGLVLFLTVIYSLACVSGQCSLAKERREMIERDRRNVI